MINDLVFFGIAIAIIAGLYVVLFGKKKDAKLKADTDIQAEAVQNAQPEPVQQNRGNARNRFAARPVAQTRQEDPEESEEEKEDANEAASYDMTGKQYQREARKQERKQQREAMLHMYEEKAKKDDVKRNKYEEREKQREEEEQKQEEYYKKIKEEQEAKEQEDFNKWKDMFTVEESGKEVDNQQNEENLLQNFIQYIKLRKVVMIDDLAAEFRLSTKDVVARIKTLEDGKMLSGIIDDRGKYIYITNKELEAIAKYIKKTGRVSRSDLILECNRQIKLNPSEEDKEKLKLEQSKLLSQIESEFKAMEGQENGTRN